MPRIKRWFPVSHDFNHDPEVRELRQMFGDWLGYAWQELLSIADRNDGIVKGSDEFISHTMARTSLGRRLDLTLKQARSGLDWMVRHGWIERCFDADSPAIRIVNHTKYHRMRDHKEIPNGNFKGSLPDLTRPNLTNNNITTESDKPIRESFSPISKRRKRSLLEPAMLEA